MGGDGNKTRRRSTEGGKRRVGLVDLDTGEVLEDGLPLYVPRKVRFEEAYLLVMQRALLELSLDRGAGLEAWRVLGYMLGTAQYENWVKVNQTEMGSALGMKRQNVGRALKALVEKGFLEKAEARINGHHIYRVNKTVAWKGKGKNWQKARHGDRPPPELRLVHRRELPAKES